MGKRKQMPHAYFLFSLFANTGNRNQITDITTAIQKTKQKITRYCSLSVAAIKYKDKPLRKEVNDSDLH